MRFIISLVVGLVCFPLTNLADEPAKIQFARDIRPILSDTCFKCHGPDAEHRAADLRLDTEQGIFDDGQVVLAGDLKSELYARITATDPDLLMPPADSGRSLTPEQISKIRLWIEQGAEYQQHWSLNPPVSHPIPETVFKSWARNPIDSFVLNALEQAGLKPNGDADRETLIRRLSLDLTGLPPSEKLFRKYRNTSGENWYKQLVDELIDSPEFGEHQTRFWLDISRYGDTHGLHLDNYREMWLYRDWLINAFNSGMPYDQFLTEQLAGDLLDNPTDQQRVATGFNRAHVTTNEGGSISEEVYVRTVVDRVSTTGTVFMGLTVGCAQCHDHKFDPISQKDFYQLFAFFKQFGSESNGRQRKSARSGPEGDERRPAQTRR